MGARENEIGPARCPLCGGVASLRLSANRLAYLAMDCCKAQLFCRGDVSDDKARALLIEPAQAKQPATPAKPDPAPAPPKPAPAPATTQAAAPPAPEPAPRPRMGWGLFPNV